MKMAMHPTTLNGIVLAMITWVILSTAGCLGDNNTAGNSDPVDPSDPSDGGNGAPKLICEEMLSSDFEEEHSLTMETDNRGINPMEGYGEIAAICTLHQGDQWISEVYAVNSNSATYDSELDKLRQEHEVIEDQSVGMKSAYAYLNKELGLITYKFLASNAATTVSFLHVWPMSLEDTRDLAREIDRNLPALDVLPDTAPNYQCPDIILESDLSTIFEEEIAYTSLTPSNIANRLSCDFGGPDMDPMPESFSGQIFLYCDPAPGQISVEDYFQVMEDPILRGYADIFGIRMLYEDVAPLPEISPYAYYYTNRFETELPGESPSIAKTPWVIFIHNRTNCCIELTAFDDSKTDLKQAMIAAAKKIDAHLQP